MLPFLLIQLSAVILGSVVRMPNLACYGDAVVNRLSVACRFLMSNEQGSLVSCAYPYCGSGNKSKGSRYHW